VKALFDVTDELGSKQNLMNLFSCKIARAIPSNVHGSRELTIFLLQYVLFSIKGRATSILKVILILLLVSK